jgi:hypothetical protein
MDFPASRTLEAKDTRHVLTANVEVTGAARLYRVASVWTAGLGIIGSRAHDLTVLSRRQEAKRAPP